MKKLAIYNRQPKKVSQPNKNWVKRNASVKGKRLTSPTPDVSKELKKSAPKKNTNAPNANQHATRILNRTFCQCIFISREKGVIKLFK